MEALYLHWFDLYFGNIIPIYLPIINTNLQIHLIWTFMIIANTLISHSDLFYFYHYDNHNDHHKHFNCNYGISCGMDKIFKTERIQDK